MYVPWEKCTARYMETVRVKRIELWEKDPATGFLRQRTATSDDVHAPLPLADHLQVDYALRRRGLALAMADLVDWHVHERLREDLMASLARPPPPGYAKVDLAQVRRADETAFQLLARLSVDGIRRLDGKRPLDELIPQVMGHRDYNMALQPLLGGILQRRPADSVQSLPGSGVSRAARKRRAQTERQGRAVQAATGNERYNAVEKGKAGDKGKTAALPLALRYPGCHATDGDNSPICFAFNIQGECPGGPPGARCPRGKHVCVLRSCGANHGFVPTHGENDYLTVPMEGDLEKSLKAPRGCMRIQRRSISCRRQSFVRVVMSRAESLNQAGSQLVLKLRRSAGS